MGAISWATQALAQNALRLTDLQQQLLQSLKDRGPGLLLELAARVLKFPEDVQEPLRELQTLGLVTTQGVAGGQFGAELFTLTALGDQMLNLLNDPQFQRDQAVAVAAADPRQQQAELLNKLGDAANAKGELDKAIEFYQQALQLTRELAADKSGGGAQ